MFPKIHLKPVIALFMGIFLFAFVMQNNFYMLPQLLIDQGFSEREVEIIESLGLVSYIIAGFLLTHLVNIISNKKIMIFALVSYLSAMICVTTIKEHDLFKAYFMTMTLGSFCYISVALVKVVEYAKQNKNYSFAVFFILLSIGYLWADNADDFLDLPNTTKLFANTFLCFLAIITVFFDEELIFDYDINGVKFSILAVNIELQAITGFIVSYVTMSLVYYYDAFAVISGIAITDTKLAKNYMMIGILIFIMPTMWLLSNTNKYLFNLLLITLFLFSFILLPIYGIEALNNIFILMIISVCLCAIFICNISILSDKFEGNELKVSILIYLTMTAIGGYCGIYSANVGGDLTNKQFIGSVCLIIICFIFYYLWRFVKLRLNH